MTASEFVIAYENKWLEFGLVPNDALRNSWEVLAKAFENCIAYNDRWSDTQTNKRLVVPMPTGSGKTTGLALYLQHLDPTKSALVVVYFTDEADKLEAKLNEVIPNKAIAIHSKNGKSISDINGEQVLIVTHEHFKKRMFDRHLDRDLILIDEAIDLMQEISITKNDLNRLTLLIRSGLQANASLSDELEIIEGFIRCIDICYQQPFRTIELGAEIGVDTTNMTHSLFLVSGSERRDNFNFEHLRRFIKHNSCSQILGGSAYSEDTENNLKQKLLKNLDGIGNFFGQWYYSYATSLENASLNTATLELPDKSVVILDATASTNHLYRLFSDVEIYTTNVSARNYANVTLHIARGFKTGKSSMLNDGNNNTKSKKSAKDLMDNLKNIETLTSDSKLLIVTHKDLEALIVDYELSCHHAVIHFGNLTGKNDWQDYDHIVIFGLMHKPKTYIYNRHALSVDPQSAIDCDLTEDINNRKKIEYSDLSSEVIQAINRVRCRNTIDEFGNCNTTNIYLTLPSGELGRTIEAEIINKMPNIVTMNWDFRTEGLMRTSSKKSSHHDSVIRYVINEIADYDEFLDASKVKKDLEIQSSTFNDLMRNNAFQEELRENHILINQHPRHTQKKVFVRE